MNSIAEVRHHIGVVRDTGKITKAMYLISSAKMKKAVNMPYWTIPDSAIDDPDELAVWTRKAYEAALRAKAVSNAPKKVKTSGSRSGIRPDSR